MTTPRNAVPLAIVGASCRFPKAAGLKQFAELLYGGVDAVTEIPDSRWNKNLFLDTDPAQPGKSYTFAAGCLDEIDRFDPGFFGMSPREAAHVDPQQRLLLELAHEAMEDAGLPGSRLSGTAVGVFVGGSAWDYSSLGMGDTGSADAYSMQGVTLSSLANRISYVFNLQGPSFTVDTACSSSLVALHLACEALRRGEVPMALVGGVNLLLAPQNFVGFSRASMLSRIGRCHAFDARADGYVRAEGGGVVLIKRLRDAVAAGDEIRAVIHATGVNSDGRTNGFSLPSKTAQAALLREVYGRASIAPDDLCYLEAHGTGTPAGDPIEAGAIGEAVASLRTEKLPIGSVKTNIGHLEAASGMAGLLKLVTALERGVIPPSLHCATPNPNIAFDALNLRLVPQALPMVPGPAGLVAGVNSFGFGGTNAHAVLAAAPARAARGTQVAMPQAAMPAADIPPLLISARSEAALEALAFAWRDHVLEAAPGELAPQLRGAARRREQHAYRLAITGGSIPALVEGLDSYLELRHPQPDATTPAVAKGHASGQAVDGKLVFVFSGNGSQWAGMARDAVTGNADFAAMLAEVDTALQPHIGWSVAEALAQGSTAEDIRQTRIAQPLLFAVQVATVAALRARGVHPTAYVGHSAGEVAAAWAAGALSLEQAARVIAHRSLQQQMTHGTGGMAVLALDAEAARAACAGIAPDLEVAAVNSAASVTVAGPAAALDALAALAKTRDWNFTRLDLDYAFHSPMMNPIQAPLLAALDGLAPSAPSEILISTVTGQPVTDATLDAAYWWHNVRDPVLFSAAIQHLIGDGARVFLEIGPKPVLGFYLADMLRRADAPGRALGSLTLAQVDGDPIALIAARCHVAGASIAFTQVFDGPATARGLPAYPWQREHFWFPKTAEAIEITAPLREHPLLGFRSDADAQVWTTPLSTHREPWLADHKVDSAVVLPAAAMIDMALAAARVRNPGATSLEILDLEITRPLILEGQTARSMRFAVTAPNGSFELSSRVRMSTEAMSLHAVGRIAPGSSDAPVLDTHGIDRAPVRTIDATSLYATAAELRLEYGAEFRTVRRVVITGPDSAAAELHPVDGGDRVEAGYLIDPAVLDGALQGLLALGASQRQSTARKAMLPWRFGRIRLLRPDGIRPRRALVRVTKNGPRAICADIALVDADGVVVAELLECWFAVVRLGGEAAPAERGFWTALVPSQRQPALTPLTDLLARARVEIGDDTPSMTALLSDAFVTASAHAAILALSDGNTLIDPGTLYADARLAPDAGALLDMLLHWLEAEDLAQYSADGWTIADATGLPPAAEIWQSVLFDAPSAGADAALVGTMGARLERVLRDGVAASAALPPALIEHMLFASPSGQHATDALTSAALAVARDWPVGRPLRVAEIGSFHAPFTRHVAHALAATGVALRYSVCTLQNDDLAARADAVAEIGGVEARLWDPADQASAARGEYDLVLGVYPFSRTAGAEIRIEPELVAALLAPGGLLLAAEPAENRIWPLVFGAATDWKAESRPVDPADSAARLLACGFAETEATTLPGGLWPVTLIAAQRDASKAASDVIAATDPVLIFAESEDPLAFEFAASLHGRLTRQFPLDALAATLTTPPVDGARDLVLMVPDTDGDIASLHLLPTLLAGIAAAGKGLTSVPGLRLWLVSHGPAEGAMLPSALLGLRRVLANELGGFDVRAIRLDAALTPAEAALRLAAELTTPDAEAEVLWTDAARIVPRLRRALPTPMMVGPMVQAGAGTRRLTVNRPGLLDTLSWETVPNQPVASDQIGIDVRAAGLNFRDVMWAMGLLPDEALLDGFSGPGLGLECAGIVTEVGARVRGFSVGDRVLAVAPFALGTHVVTFPHAAIRLPDTIDFAAAATVPVAFLTVVYALGRLAQLEPGERVLIHGGAGGVGLAAIQYAKHRGAIVFATAGSDVKRDMMGLLGVDGVFDSRSARFADEVMAATGGEGVDVVLNSLSGDLMEQSLRIMRPFGRFLEIGKRDLYKNTAVGIRPLRHNISYFAIDADELAARKPSLAQSVLAEVAELLSTGDLKPLPHRVYGFHEATDAFRLLQASGHIGKVVLIPGEDEAVTPAPAKGFVADAGGVYVVTGGLSGFGLETAKWLARHGACKLALLGRRGADTPGIEPVLADFVRTGIAARAYACDVGDEAALTETLDTVRGELGPITGVVHAAMVLDDALLPDLTAVRFDAVFAPKLAGGAHLDKLTRNDPISLFVLYSSVTTTLGNPGQANYVAANLGLEAIAERRCAAGLPGLAVQWGPIADAGYLARETRVAEALGRMLGSAHLTAAEALDALPTLLASGLPVAGYADIQWSAARRQMPGLATPMFADLPEGKGGEGGASFREMVRGLAPDAAREMVLEALVEAVAGILKLQPNRIDANRPLAELGMDSLMAVELRLALETRLGIDLPLLSLSDGATLKSMAARVVRSLDSEAAQAPPAQDELVSRIMKYENVDELADTAAETTKQTQPETRVDAAA